MLMGIGLGVLFWLLESATDVLIFHKGNLTERIFVPDVHEIWIRSLAVIILIGLSVYARFVTTQGKQAEEALGKINQFNEALVRVIPLGMDIVDEECNILYLSEKTKSLLGKEAVGKRCFFVYKRECLSCPVKKGLKVGETKIIEIKEMLTGKTFLISHTGMIYQSKKTILRIFEDISRQKMMEKELKRIYKAKRHIIEDGRFGIAIVNEKGNVEYVNSMQLKISGNTYEQMKCLNVFSLPTYERTGLTEKIRAALKGEFFRMDSVEYTSYYGRKTTIRNFIGIPLEEEGVKKVLLIIEDITESKRAEEEKEKLKAHLIRSEKMAAFGTMAIGLMHEFSNLLQIVSGYVEFIQRTKKVKDIKEALNIVLDTADKAINIVRDLLTFSKQELSKKELCDITGPIESVLWLAENQLKRDNIQVVRKYEETPMVEINKAEIQQVFLAIVINAQDAMLPKGGNLEISVKQVNGNVEVSFSDTGKGIREKNLSKIFEPFYTTRKVLRGDTVPVTWLGLFVSYGVVHRHGGEIEAKSQVGQGTTLTVRLPVKEVEPKERIVEQ